MGDFADSGYVVSRLNHLGLKLLISHRSPFFCTSLSLHLSLSLSRMAHFHIHQHSCVNVHIIFCCYLTATSSQTVFFFLNPQEGQTVCWMEWTQTRCMWLMPFDSFLSFPSPRLPFLVRLNVKVMGSLPSAVWIHWLNASLFHRGKILLRGPELWGRVRGRKGGRETKLKTVGWVCLKGLSAFWDHDTVKIFCGRSLQDIPPSM